MVNNLVQSYRPRSLEPEHQREGSLLQLEIPYRKATEVETAIDLWLRSKLSRCGSEATRRNYASQFHKFREWLKQRGRDVNDPDTIRLAEEAQAWASRDRPAHSSYNHRLTILSSFYKYVRKHRLLILDNPIDFLDRKAAPPYPDVKTLELEHVRTCLASIDRTTLHGQRDFAFLVVALTTGRRRAELAALRMGDLEFAGERVTLIWRRTKGGKVMRDTLSALTKQALLEYLYTLYGPDLTSVVDTAGVWVSVAAHNKGKPLASTAVFRICHRRFGITSVHRLRHTFAHVMEEAGAKVSDIQASLGHSSLATTSIYLSALRRLENPSGDAIAALFGLGELMAKPASQLVVRCCQWCSEPLDVFALSNPSQKYCSTTCKDAAYRKQRAQRRQQARSFNTQARAEATKDESGDPSPHSTQLSLW